MSHPFFETSQYPSKEYFAEVRKAICTHWEFVI
jgi:hypothetical protein